MKRDALRCVKINLSNSYSYKSQNIVCISYKIHATKGRQHMHNALTHHQIAWFAPWLSVVCWTYPIEKQKTIKWSYVNTTLLTTCSTVDKMLWLGEYSIDILNTILYDHICVTPFPLWLATNCSYLNSHIYQCLCWITFVQKQYRAEN